MTRLSENDSLKIRRLSLAEIAGEMSVGNIDIIARLTAKQLRTWLSFRKMMHWYVISSAWGTRQDGKPMQYDWRADLFATQDEAEKFSNSLPKNRFVSQFGQTKMEDPYTLVHHRNKS